MKKIGVLIALLLPLVSYAESKCDIGKVAFYGKLEGDVGYQRLCYDNKTQHWILGIKGKENKRFVNSLVTLDRHFNYVKDNERVEGYAVLIGNHDRLILMKNTVNGVIQQGLSIIGDEAIPFVNDSVIYNDIQ